MDRAGFTHFADDAVILTCGPDQTMAHAMPFAPRLRPSSRAHFDRLDGGSAVAVSAPRPTTLPLGAVVLLRQDPAAADTHVIRNLTAAHAFVRLLPHAYMFDPHDTAERRRMVEHYLAMVSHTPVFELTYRPDFKGLPALVEAVAALVPAPATA
jgi:hypothetical protein